jgi:hypothetical protein
VTDPLLSFAEIGTRLGITEEEAYSAYRTAIKKIRVFLRKRPELAEEIYWFLDSDRSLVQKGASYKQTVHFPDEFDISDETPADSGFYKNMFWAYGDK